ncbi:MAG: PAS domain S-box protein, partial [Methylococcales bacterium]|nr:PAS domain S-box protein [Methylococcales bacterium]
MKNKVNSTEQGDINLSIMKIAVEQSASAVVITNAQGAIEYVNPKFIELTGYSAE